MLFTENFTVSGIAVDRFLAVSHPFEYNERVTVAKTTVAILIMWVYAFSLTYLPPILGYHRWVPNVECYLINIWLKEGFWIQCTNFFLVTLIIYMMYAAMFRIAVGQIQIIAATMIGNTSQEAAKIKMHLKAAKTLLLVTGTFSVCCLPLVVNLTYIFQTDKINPGYVSREVQPYLIILLFLNCAVNPIIYARRLPGFKSEFIRVLTCGMFKGTGGVSPAIQAAPAIQVAPVIQVAPEIQVAPVIQVAPAIQVAPEIQVAPVIQVAPEIQMRAVIQGAPAIQGYEEQSTEL